MDASLDVGVKYRISVTVSRQYAQPYFVTAMVVIMTTRPVTTYCILALFMVFRSHTVVLTLLELMSNSRYDETNNNFLSPVSLKSDTEYRLEFLHIPKTGGTLIEVIAKEHGVSWGACKFDPPWRHRRNSKSVLKDCPEMSRPQFPSHTPLWHYPIDKLYKEYPNFRFEDPYDNLSIEQSESQHLEKKFFSVVRNPYDWFLSLHRILGDNQDLNSFVSSYMDQAAQKINVCQYEFLYNTSSPWDANTQRYKQRIVEPQLVVRMESLKEELEALWKRHGMNWTLPEPTERAVNVNKRKVRMTVANFSRTSLQRIHGECRLDFLEGPYEMVDLANWPTMDENMYVTQ